MVGLVIVSHSRDLALALVELVRQVSNTDLPIAAAAGVGPDRSEFGTDAVEIMEAIESVYSPDGALILMDLGSAILSAEMALELLPPEMTNNIRFCAAPVVEGAIAAGVQIGLGADLETVCQEAQSALLPKIDHIAESTGSMPAGLVTEPSQALVDAEEVVLTLHTLHGLHARPAARFVQTAAGFDANIQVRNLSTGKGPVSAKSLNALATLGALRDHQIAVTASGAQASQALSALQELVEGNFGERPEAIEFPRSEAPVLVATEAVRGALQAVPVSEGVALGPFYYYRPQPPPIPQEPAENPQEEWGRLQRALEMTRNAIRKRRTDLAATIGENEAAIFDAHLLILEDPDLLEEVYGLIFNQGQNAAAAWDTTIKAIAENYRGLEDPYLQQRAADVQDVGNQVLFSLADKLELPVVEFNEPVILFAHELTPTETSQLDMSQVLGLVTVGGGPTSHSAILARALGIPAIAGASANLERNRNGTMLAIDGFNGYIWVNPSEDLQAEIQQRRVEWLTQRESLLTTSHELAITRDNRRVEIVANVGNVMDAQAALANGAEGIGLLRTEFLYITRETPPTESEQIESLRQIGEALSADGNPGRPIIVRTLDVGGDKALPYLPLAEEANPFLGVRAIRLSLGNPELFRIQLRAILLAGEAFDVRIMFPMVANLEEIQAARHLLEEAHLSLAEEGLSHRWPIETGIMIEVPAAALLSPQLAPHVDFFSIGTNDLTQYTLAAERGNPQLSNLADALHPAVLQLIDKVSHSAHEHGKWVGICGELAGDPLAIPLLVGLGVDELSMNPGSIPRAKAIVRVLKLSEAQQLAGQALQAIDVQQVRQIARDFHNQLEGKLS